MTASTPQVRGDTHLTPQQWLPSGSAIRITVTTAVALVTAGILSGIALQRPEFAIVLFGAGVGGGVLVGIGKQIAAKVLGYQDRSLAEMATDKVGHIGLWGGGGVAATLSLPVFPMASIAGAGFVAGEAATNKALDLAEEIPYHVKGLASFIKTFHQEYPSGWKYILGGAAALVGLAVFIYVMPGSGTISLLDLDIPTKVLETLGGLALGLVAIGAIRLYVVSKPGGKDPGDLSSYWSAASAKERRNKLAIWAGSAVLFTGAMVLMFYTHNHIGVAYLMAGLAASGLLWTWFPSLPVRSARAVKQVGGIGKSAYRWIAPS